MACSQTLNGISTDCSNSIGGIKAVYMANASDITTPTEAEGSYSLTASDMAKFKEYAIDRYSSSLTTTFTKSDNGARYWASELTLQFRKMSAEKNAELNALSYATLAVVVLDNNGEYWYLSDVEMNGGTAQTGQAIDDLNGYAPTFSANHLELPLRLTSFSLTSN